jgi:alkylation response protein AidB-like acyl-CoA dehydrogenase
MESIEETLRRAAALDALFMKNEREGDEELRALHSALVSLGLQRAFLPERYGGMGKGISEEMFLIESIAKSDVGLAFLVALPYLAIEPIFLRRKNDLLLEFSEALVKDEPVNWALAMTEEQGGASIEDSSLKGETIETRITREGRDYRINGRKVWVSNATRADWYLVVCRDPEERVTLAYAPAGIRGLSVGTPMEKIGCLSDTNAEIHFENVVVPERFVIEDAWNEFRAVVALGRLGSAFMATGIASRALEEVAGYASRRNFRGELMKEHTMHAGIIGRMNAVVHCVRSYCTSIASQLEAGRLDVCSLLPEASRAKLLACKSAEWVSSQAIELLGARGVSAGSASERSYRDSKVIEVWEGGQQLEAIEASSDLF